MLFFVTQKINKKYICIFFYIILFNISCTHEPKQTIPVELQQYVDEFFKDARQKGINIDLTDFNLDISFANLPGADGRCYFSGNKVIIDSIFWKQAHPLRRRALLYHELGHCILNRRHENAQHRNGECKSIMRADYDCSENFVSEKWWDYYLNELFTSNQELPTWYDWNEKTTSTYIKNYENFDTTLYVDVNLERTPDLMYNFKLDHTKNFQISLHYHNFPIEIVPKIRTKFLQLSASSRYISIDFNYNFPFDYNLDMDVFRKTFETSSNQDIILTIKYKDKLLFFFVNQTLVHVCNYTITEPVSLYNINYKQPTPIQIEAGNI